MFTCLCFPCNFFRSFTSSVSYTQLSRGESANEAEQIELQQPDQEQEELELELELGLDNDDYNDSHILSLLNDEDVGPLSAAAFAVNADDEEPQSEQQQQALAFSSASASRLPKRRPQSNHHPHPHPPTPSLPAHAPPTAPPAEATQPQPHNNSNAHTPPHHNHCQPHQASPTEPAPASPSLTASHGRVSSPSLTSSPAVHSSPSVAPLTSPPSLLPLSSLKLPGGTISEASFRHLLSSLDVSSLSYSSVFSFLVSAPHRALSGDVFRALLSPVIERARHAEKEKKASRHAKHAKHATPADPADHDLPAVIFQLFDFLCRHTRAIHTDKTQRTLKFSFDFHGESSRLLELSTPLTYVLESRHASDPYLVCPANTPVKSTVDVRRLIFHKEVIFQLADSRSSPGCVDGSIKAVRDGDIQLKKFLSFNAGLRYEHREGLVDLDSENRTYLLVNRAGQPIVRGHHYVPVTYDDWIVVTVLKQEVYIGLPRFQQKQI